MKGLFMAGANLPAKKYQKTTPTITRLSFECTGGTTQFVDIGAALSALNRRSYRAGVYYYVNSVEIYNNEQGVVDFHTLPDNYITKNAWNRGFRHYQKMNALVDTPRSKWHDFKVYMSNLHRTTGTLSPSLHDINAASQVITADEWAYSVFTSADDDGDSVQDADNFTMHMLGPHVGNSGNWTSVGAIKSYQDSRTLPAANGTPQTFVAGPSDPLLNLFDFSSEEMLNEIATNLASSNDQPPYDKDQFVGVEADHMMQVARIGTEIGAGRVGRASGFCVPFGLLCIDPQEIGTPYRVVLNIAQGTYHGVYAERA
jgi:hypothetical protein